MRIVFIVITKQLRFTVREGMCAGWYPGLCLEDGLEGNERRAEGEGCGEGGGLESMLCNSGRAEGFISLGVPTG